MVTVLEYSEQW